MLDATGLEPVVMTLTDVIRHNLKELRGSKPRREVADEIALRFGDRSWNQWRIFDIEGRKGRDRVISPEELLTLAMTYDVSLIELMTAPDTFNAGTKKNPDVRPVVVRAGMDQLSPGAFFRVAFMLPPNLRDRWGRMSYTGGTEGELAPGSEMARRASVWMEAVRALYTDDELRERFPDVEPLGEEELGQLYAEDGEKIGQWVIDNYGVSELQWIFADRPREWISGLDAEQKGRRE